ncbi:TRAP transporter small permease [Ferrovibrio sp.]|uniref:TRAP transporter small permease n=1 Tax=Ferrovibrio sp. TaxID=1917215 RepID=UPI000CAE59E3|nr:TRAP transporter small permease [Ferrovibrio sp.]PJI37689.1 MAG: TRAP transporter permease DctQ [Ferrovibrio sp.]
MNRFVSLVRMLSRVSGAVAVLLTLLSIGIVCQMIFQRAVLEQSTIWQTEFVIFALIAATFVGAPYVLLTRGHVNVDLLPLMAGHRTRVAMALVSSVLALAFCATLFWSSIFWWHDAYVTDRLTSSMWRARVWIPYLSLPVGMGLLCLQYIADIWAIATGRDMPFGLKPEDRP